MAPRTVAEKLIAAKIWSATDLGDSLTKKFGRRRYVQQTGLVGRTSLTVAEKLIAAKIWSATDLGDSLTKKFGRRRYVQQTGFVGRASSR